MISLIKKLVSLIVRMRTNRGSTVDNQQAQLIISNSFKEKRKVKGKKIKSAKSNLVKSEKMSAFRALY